METPPDDSLPRAVICLLCVLIAAGLVIGVWAFGPFVLREHQRLSPLQGALVWLGDATALLWFAVYLVRHFLLGVPIRAPAVTTRGAGKLWWLALLSICASLGVDLWITLSLRESEREAFARAQRVVGSIDRLAKGTRKERIVYVLRCSYLDANGAAHSAVFHVRDPDSLPRMAPAVVQAVRAEQLPVSVDIAYEPSRPERSWLADLGWDYQDRMYYFSLSFLLMQALCAMLFVYALAQARRSTGSLPWWYDLHGVFLVAVEAALVLLFGGTGLIFDLPQLWNL